MRNGIAIDTKNVGMIGLGLMGTALTERLLEAGYAVWVHNRTREKADPLVARGAQWAENPLDVCDRVLISLYTTDTVEEVLAQLDGGLRPGQILIDTTTGEPEQTVRLGARLAARGVSYLDAPISGSSEQTRRGEATAIVGGPQEVFTACRDLFDSCAQRTIYAGPCGSGSRMKLVSNLVLGLNRAGLAEGLVFARTLGIDLDAALQVLIGSMAYSRIMDTKGRKMIEGDFRTQARLAQHLKDIRLILAAATAAGQDLPLTETHCRLLEAAESAGFGDADNSAIIRAFDRKTAE
jgi:3-hydroxyisobutyrate dehydrogenase-like beta-hydroxyacid dehydrogenase